MKVLIADDDRVLATLLSSRLRARGVESVVVHDATQALMTAMRSPPDAIILDIQMPGGTGIQTLRRLKASTKTSSVRVVVLSAHAGPDLPEQAFALGADEVLRKPTDPDAVYRVLCKVLGQPVPENDPPSAPAV